ncbi:hydroxyproline-rich glycoprotein family protein [Striga asiatica]|uniref:Hydroxyproline-rich glycoprotein family protein n=1 Tax=Striga asiatica TaxID=4170 RepID=A0A5A7QBA1_STRAF|nr:hydroxyproline-rich glycoprotein family protein [Striga asiatica]
MAVVEVIPNSKANHGVGRPQALHSLGRLIIEKLNLCHFQECIRNPHQHKLRQQNKNRHLFLLVSHPHPHPHPPVALGESCNHHYDNVNEHANPHSLEEADSAWVPSPSAQDSHEDAVVKHNRYQHGYCDKRCQAGGGNLMPPTDASVKSRALLHEQRGYLRDHCSRDEGGNQDRYHLDHLFCFLNMGHRA